MKYCVVILLLAASAANVFGQLILSDTYAVTNSGSGFALGSGVNSGINPPTTRLTGTAAANLRYIKAYGTKPDSCHYITNNAKMGVALSSVDSSTLSFSTGSGAYDFSSALSVSTASPAQPLTYDLTINMANATAAANQRCSFAISSTSGNAGVWDFGIQIYRATTSDTAYTLQKRVSTGASGLTTAVNAVISTVGTYPNESAFLIRVTDAGAESTTFSSRIRISTDGGSTWIYDTASDSALPNGWRFPKSTRYVFFDIAPSSGPVTYDNFSMTLNSVIATNPPAVTNGMVLSDQFNVVGSGSGFALGSGVNTGINPPTTRLTGPAANGLRYIKAFGTKPDSDHTITNNKLSVALNAANSSTLSFSTGGSSYDFGPILGVSAASPAQPLTYDLTINIANATVAANQRCSFAISSTPGGATVWDFGIQLYRANATDTFYTLQRRVSTSAGGLDTAVNAAIGTVGTYSNEVDFLIHVTDAGAEAGSYDSRIQVSTDGGTNWIYDTSADMQLPNGWCFPGGSRYLFYDVASGTGPVTYDNFTLSSEGLSTVSTPTNSPLVILANEMTANGFQMTWQSEKNTNYTVLKSTNLNSSAWVLATNVTATGINTTILNGSRDAAQTAEFYRVAQLTASGLALTNVLAGQRPGTDLVDIYYDLGDLYGSYASISVLVSTDGGLTYHAAAATFSGDVGGGVSPGSARHIVWNAGADGLGASVSNVCVEVVADRAPVGTNMALVPAGTFNMGDTESPDGMTNEFPVHAINIDAFYPERCEVSKGLWDTVAQWGTNHGYSFDSPAVAAAANLPVQQVSWYDAVKWCNARSEKEGLSPAYFLDKAWTSAYRTGQVNLAEANVRWTGAGYRLLTEAEWEKAARGGLEGKRFPWGDTINETQANYWSTTFESYDVNGTSGPNPQAPLFPNTLPVGSFPPTGYGLYDIVGNTWVWCWDYYGDTWYANTLATNANTHGPSSASWGGDRVYRGGSGVDNSWKCRVSNRADAPPRFAMGHFGLRVALPADNALVVAQSTAFTFTP